jgi:hypothetical protein
MSATEIFESAVRSKGDFAGVFEYDDDTGYFYLYGMEGAENQKVLGSIQVLTGDPDFEAEDVSVTWDIDEKRVGLLIRKVLWAVFDASTRATYGGHYRAGGTPSVPPEVARSFATDG